MNEVIIDLCKKIISNQNKLEKMDDYDLKNRLLDLSDKEDRIAALQRANEKLGKQYSDLSKQFQNARVHAQKLRERNRELELRIHDLTLALETIGATLESGYSKTK